MNIQLTYYIVLTKGDNEYFQLPGVYHSISDIPVYYCDDPGYRIEEVTEQFQSTAVDTNT